MFLHLKELLNKLVNYMKAKKDFPFLTFFIVAAVSILLILPLRIYQYFEILEPETGFYSEKDFSVYLVYALMLIVIVFSIVVSLINKKSLINNNCTFTKSNAAVFIVASLGFLADAADKAISFIDIYNSYIHNFKQSIFQYISKEGGVIFFLQAMFAMISSLYFLVLAIGVFTGKDNAPSLKLIALAPSLWAAMRLLFRFKSTISFTNVSELFLELFAVVFIMMFFFALAQTFSKVDKGENYWKIFAYGVPAAVFGLACFVPRAVLSVIGHQDLMADGYTPVICDFTIALLILSVLISKVSLKSANK